MFFFTPNTKAMTTRGSAIATKLLLDKRDEFCMTDICLTLNDFQVQANP